MREPPVPRLSRLPSMGSQQRLPWPSVCGSLELTARSRRSSSSAWILPSRGSVCPFSHPCFRWSTLLTDKIDILFSFPFFHPLLPSSRQQVKETCFSFFCLLASISLRIPWAWPDQRYILAPRRRIASCVRSFPCDPQERNQRWEAMGSNMPSNGRCLPSMFPV